MGTDDPNSMKAWAGLALGAVIVGNVSGNMFMKLASMPNASQVQGFGFVNIYTLLGLLCFGAGVLLYAWSLQYVDLHFAQAVVSLQFAGAVLLASYFFGEIISVQKWFGLGLIFIGLIVCAK